MLVSRKNLVHLLWAMASVDGLNLYGLASAGLNQVMVLPNFDTRTQVLDRISKDIIPHVRDS